MATKNILRTPEEIKAFVAKAKQYPLLACDTETEEFSEEKTLAWELALEGVGFYGEDPELGKIQAYIPISTLNWKQELAPLFKTGGFIFHNAKFDLQVLEENGVTLQGDQVEDTLLLSWLLDENRNRHGLKALAADILKKKDVTKFTDVAPKPTEENLGLFRGELEMRTVEWEDEMGKYCIEDCLNTWKLYQKFSKQIKEEDNLWEVYRKMEIPFVFVLKDMERRGIKVDTDYLQGLADTCEKELKELITKIVDLTKKPAINLDSPKQVREALTGMGLKIPAQCKTPSGEISTNEAALSAIAEVHEIGKFLLRYRELSKLRNTYMLGLQKQAKNGVIHTSFLHTGTVTGRLSSKAPNLQNIPRRDDDFNIRKAFKPRDGYIFINADYSQLELRIAAHFSKDPTLVEAYETGKDVHKATADKLNVSRNVAKTVNFGLLYGRTAYGLAEGLGMTPDAAERFLAHYFEQFPGLKRFMDIVINTVRQKKRVFTITKRKRRFPGYGKIPVPKGRKLADLTDIEKKEVYRERMQIMKRMERMGVNSMVQGSAADIMKLAMRNMVKRLKGRDATMLLQIHDEVLVECKKEEAEEIMQIVKEEMEGSVKLGTIPLITEPKITAQWEK